MNNKIFHNKYLNRISAIELIISEKCQNECMYCYRVKHHNKSKMIHATLEDLKIQLKNIDKMFGSEILKTRRVELFGGDPVLNYDILSELFTFMSNNYPGIDIILPTNSKLIQELTFNDIDKLIKRGKNNSIFFSLSVDGPYSDDNRKLSKFGVMNCYNPTVDYDHIKRILERFKGRFGLHPMLHFKSTDNWLKTVKFFYKQFNHIPYLLEVRHSLTKEEGINAVQQLIAIRKYVKSLDKYKDIEAGNTITSSICPRGLGCSALTTMCIMPNGDIPFCHRLVEKPFVYGNIYKEQFNKEMAISYTSLFDFRNLALCMECVLRKVCVAQCLGANFEYWGDPFIMNPSICDYFKLKYYAMIKNFKIWKKSYDKRYINTNKLQIIVKRIYGDDIDDKI